MHYGTFEKKYFHAVNLVIDWFYQPLFHLLSNLVTHSRDF